MRKGDVVLRPTWGSDAGAVLGREPSLRGQDRWCVVSVGGSLGCFGIGRVYEGRDLEPYLLGNLDDLVEGLRALHAGPPAFKVGDVWVTDYEGGPEAVMYLVVGEKAGTRRRVHYAPGNPRLFQWAEDSVSDEAHYLGSIDGLVAGLRTLQDSMTDKLRKLADWRDSVKWPAPRVGVVDGEVLESRIISWPEYLAEDILADQAPHPACSCVLCALPRGGGWAEQELLDRLAWMGREVGESCKALAVFVSGAVTTRDYVVQFNERYG